MLNVVITGGSGLIGTQLAKLLIRNNYSVTVLSRSKKTSSNNINYSFWDIKNKLIDVKVITQAQYIIHLAGEGIAEKRWTEQRKADILSSRAEPLRLIYEVLSTNKNNLEAFISASGVGFYGAITSNRIFTEDDLPNSDFLGKTCRLWEDEVDLFQSLKIRTVKLRTGIVISNKGGALPKMIAPFKYGLGSPIGTGKQFMPWIHLDDLCNMYLFAIENDSINGAYNAAVEDDTTNESFSKIVSMTLGKKILLPHVPSFVLKILLGEMASIILNGSRVTNAKIKTAGFQFLHEDLEKCLEQELVVKKDK